jgi:hypothetical protein
MNKDKIIIEKRVGIDIYKKKVKLKCDDKKLDPFF